MDPDSKLERVANARGLYARPDATPEGCVQQDYIHGRVNYICCELFKTNYHCVSRQRQAHFLAHASHPGHPEYRVFQIVVADILDLLTEPNSCFGGPDAVWVKPEAVTVKRGSKLAITLQLVLRRKDTTFQLVRGEAV